jgi:arsenate reductase-like glutaredoxin family protein
VTHAKKAIRILKNCGFEESNTDVFKDIVRHNNIENLLKNCPNSFERFYQDIEELKNSL